ncbi:hypothetical protein [Sneathiella chinensis]|uniref:Flagellar protein FlgN n=1 Tax=Sneathiella chinensis TaxID=349750 RepID=A0ABQ5U9E4_9PROT|nr:hypothetical protein [Sneathiella chinensis]GLQ07803.1 hypothetical protein GCM10007924_30250 [Sneathiella chinensis]
MSETDNGTALHRLLALQQEFEDVDIGKMPREKAANLLNLRRIVYLEVQALQARAMTGTTDRYTALTSEFKASEGSLRALRDWAEEARKTDAMVGNLFKGLTFALGLL